MIRYRRCSLQEELICLQENKHIFWKQSFASIKQLLYQVIIVALNSENVATTDKFSALSKQSLGWIWIVSVNRLTLLKRNWRKCWDRRSSTKIAKLEFTRIMNSEFVTNLCSGSRQRRNAVNLVINWLKMKYPVPDLISFS